MVTCFWSERRIRMSSVALASMVVVVVVVVAPAPVVSRGDRWRVTLGLSGGAVPRALPSCVTRRVFYGSALVTQKCWPPHASSGPEDEPEKSR